ncbi:GNAT family N-acetyltransferase, partial [Candidatus Nomurabacteria bacterium]|nr:GNAT family N-acetyltransferase [Candidatus Nomurabacteria bacterium]
MKEVSLTKAILNEENINTFILIQNSVANPKTFRMGYVTEEKACLRFIDAKVFFIKEDGQTVGTLEYQLGAGDYAYIQSIAILPEFQGKGIGRQSLVFLLSNQLKRVSKIGLNTHPKNKALSIY